MLANDIVKLYEVQQRQDQAIFEQWNGIGRMLLERKMSEPEILDLFSRIETGMTNKATGANRTMLGRGKDTATDFVGGIKNAVKGVLDGMQNSVPMSAVEVVYNKATDALANVAGGQSGKIMQVIKGYRNLAKEYPKTTGLVKSALIAVAGMATSGLGPIAVVGLLSALDSALKGNKLFKSLTDGAGAAALSFGARELASLAHGSSLPSNTGGSGSATAHDMDMMSNMGDVDPATGKIITPDTQFANTYGDASYGGPEAAAGTDTATGTGAAAGGDIAGQFAGGQYTVVKGDELGFIAQAQGVSAEDIKALNPQIEWSKPLQPGMTLNLPPQGDGSGSVWQGYTGGVYGDKAANMASNASASGPSDAELNSWRNRDLERMQGQAWADQPDDYSWVNGGRSKVRESARVPTRFIASTLPIAQLYDREATIKNLNLREGRKNPAHVSIHLTRAGVYKVFENVLRYNNYLYEAEAMGPGRGDLPAEYRPDMPGGSGGYDKSKKGIIGKGLDWLDRTAGKVGGALKNFGHQLTTNVTKEKLKMNWHQEGKKADSDAIADFLKKQGVPVNVIADVYSQMGLPVPPSMGGTATVAPVKTTTPTASTAVAPAPTKSTSAVAPTTGAAGSAQSWANPTSPDYVGRREVARRQATGGATATRGATAMNPGYKSVTQGPVKFSGMAAPKPTAPAAPGSWNYKSATNLKPTVGAAAPGAVTPTKAPATTSYTPTEKEKEEYQKAIQQKVTNENLKWAKSFDPGMTVWKKMKSE